MDRIQCYGPFSTWCEASNQMMARTHCQRQLQAHVIKRDFWIGVSIASFQVPYSVYQDIHAISLGWNHSPDNFLDQIQADEMDENNWTL